MGNLSRVMKIFILILFMVRCQTGVNSGGDDEKSVSTQRLHLEGDPAVTILQPSNYQYFYTSKSSNPKHPLVDITVSFEVSNWEYPGNDRAVWFFIDGIKVDTTQLTEPKILYNIDKGMHTLSVCLYQKVGENWVKLSNSEACNSITIKVSIIDCWPKVWSPDEKKYVCDPEHPEDQCCIDNNPCSTDSCVLSQGEYKCAYGPTSIPNCCMSDFDCEEGTKCYLDDAVSQFKNRCVECFGTNAECDDGNLCTEDICEDDWFCSHSLIFDKCCTSDSDCVDDDPCTIDYCDFNDKPDGYTGPAGRCHNVPYKEKWADTPENNNFWLEHNLVKEAYADCCTQEKMDYYCDKHKVIVDGELVQDVCWNVACIANKCRYGHVPDPLCCNTAAECEDEICHIEKKTQDEIEEEKQNGTWDGKLYKTVCIPNQCTYDYCVNNHCEFEPNPFPPADIECCKENKDCDDGNPATIDWCDTTKFACKHKDNPLYCDEDANPPILCEQPDNPCLEIKCINNTCTPKPIKGCCLSKDDCDDGDACTSDVCNSVTHECEHIPIPTIGGKKCCNTSKDCQDDLVCTVNVCIAHRCREGKLQQDPNKCESLKCCENNDDLDGDGEADQCADDNPCTKWQCVAHCCVKEINETDDNGNICCLTALDCPTDDPFKQYTCEDNVCKELPPVYCSDINDSCDDDNVCTQDTCNTVAGLCSHTPIPNCCVEDSDCVPQNPDPCKKYKCNKATNPPQCEVYNISNCCLEDSDCNDGNLCTQDLCVNKACRYIMLDPECCQSDGDCTKIQNECTQNKCVNGTCKYTALDGENCCSSDTECDDNDNSTKDLCVDHICVHKYIPDFCEPDGKAPVQCNDNNPCTADWCLYGKCRHFPPGQAPFDSDIPPGCCATVDDCEDDNNPCTTTECVNGLCVYEPVEQCILDLPYFQDFNHYVTLKDKDGNPVIGFAKYIKYLGWELKDLGNDDTFLNWRYSTEGPLGFDYHLRFDGVVYQSEGFNSFLFTPYFRLRETPNSDIMYNGITVQWDNFLKIFQTDPLSPQDVDLTVYVMDGDNIAAAFPLWSITTTTSMDDSVEFGISLENGVDFSTFGDTIRLAFNISNLDGDSSIIQAWDIDNVRICKGKPPKFVNVPDDFTIGTFYYSNKIVKIEASDADQNDVLSFQLLNAPEFISLKNYNYNYNSKKYEVNLVIDPEGDESKVGEYDITLKVSDGCLETKKEVKVFVLYGKGYVIWLPEGVSPLHAEAIKEAIEKQPDQNVKDRKVQIISNLAAYPDLSVLDGIFVVMGIKGKKHVFEDSYTYDENGDKILIPNEEQALLANYLDSGGRLYLEGGDTWCEDPHQPLFDYFRIKCKNSNYPKAKGPIKGVNFYTGLDYSYSQLPYNPNDPDNYWNNFPDAIDIAYQNDYKFPRILQRDSGNDDAPLTISFENVLETDDNGNPVLLYRTIGTSLPFGGYIDGTNATKIDLMGKILYFFENGYPPCENDDQCIDGQECTIDKCDSQTFQCNIQYIEGCTYCVDDRDCDLAYMDEKHACQSNFVCTGIPGDKFLGPDFNVLINKFNPVVESTLSLDPQAFKDLVNSVNLKIQLSHQYMGDLRITLSHLNKEVVVKEADPSDSTNAYFYTFEVGRDALGSFADFKGDTVAGDWTLKIEDTKPNNFKDGKLIQWYLFIVPESETCNSDADCVDGNACTKDLCQYNYCMHELIDCDDNNLCTVDSCDPTKPEGQGCSNVEIDCSDDSPCTIDSCDPQTGKCIHEWPPTCGGACTTHADCGFNEYCGTNDLGEKECLPIGGMVYKSNLTGSMQIPDDSSVGITNINNIVSNKRKIVRPVVKVFINHEAIGDLLITLTKGDKTVTLHNLTGGDANGNVWVFGTDPKFDQVDGPGSLDDFKNEIVEGEWKLQVVDKKFGNTGTLDNWALFFVETECNLDADCNDNNLCTEDSCIVNDDPETVGKILKLCQNSNIGDLCDDGLFCNGVEQCHPLTGCIPGEPPKLDDGIDCTDDICDEVDDKVYHIPNNTYCNDGNECTDDVCSIESGKCIHINNTASCDDGIYCTSNDKCSNGECSGTYDPTIEGCSCTTDADCPTNIDRCKGVYYCDNGVCKIDETQAVVCDTSNDTECLKNVCDPADGECKMTFVEAGIMCDDGNLCTKNDMCDGKGACVGDEKVCDDGYFCNGQEVCNPSTGQCEAQNVPVVDDGINCTVDVCDAVQKKVFHFPDNSLCDDEKFCNGEEICDPNIGCTNGVPPNCNDYNPCTVDVCDPVTDQCDHSEHVQHCNWPCDGDHPYDAGDNDCGYDDACVGGAGDGSGMCTPICSGTACTVVRSGDLNLAIPDNDPNCLTQQLVVDSPYNFIKNVNVKVGVLHTAIFDLTLKLTDPEGYSVLMWKNFGQDNDNFYNTFSSSYADTFEPMCAFRGDDPSGVWTLEVCDNYPNNTGKLLYWNIYVEGSDQDTAVGDRCDNAIYLDSSDGDHTITNDTTCFQEDMMGSCGGTGKEIVYKFQISDHKLITANIGTGIDWVLYLKGSDGNSCATGNIACSNSCDANSCGEQLKKKLAPGTYYLVVDSDGGYGEFSMNVNFHTLKPNGGTCSTSDDCISDYCVDGVCCNSACDGLCEMCDGKYTVSGVAGECSPIKDNLDPEEECTGDDPICGGVCNGNGDCKFAGPSVKHGPCQQCDGNGYWKYVDNGQDPFDDCQDRYCDGYVLFYEQRCDGNGGCDCYDTKYGVFDCDASTDHDYCPGGYACQEGLDNNNDGLWDDCRTDCTAQSHCRSEYFCDLLDDGVEQLNTCVLRYDLGHICHAEVSYNECKDDNFGSPYPCVDGVCCENSCTGLCQACNVPGSEGSCVNIPDDNEPDQECVDLCKDAEINYYGSITNCCADGRCDGNGSCTYPGTNVVCHEQSCGVNNNNGNDADWGDNLLFLTDYCNGNGFCVDSGYEECPGGYMCNADKTDCLTSCTSDLECFRPNDSNCASSGGVNYYCRFGVCNPVVCDSLNDVPAGSVRANSVSFDSDHDTTGEPVYSSECNDTSCASDVKSFRSGFYPVVRSK